MTFEILDPTSAPAASTALAPRVRDDVHGARIGVLWNGRPNGDRALHQILGSLAQTYTMDVTVFEKKPLIGNMAPEEIFQEMVNSPVDYVLAGVGD